MTTPAIVTHYLTAAHQGDFTALADCFTSDGTVIDEGNTYRGRAAIIGWRESVASQWTYTTTVTGAEPTNDGGFRVTARVEGDFPGGVADLTFRFTVRDGLIAALSIGD